jgi:hypothetical protein
MLTCRACGVVLALALTGESAAADNKQTCQAVTVMVQALNADTGAWLDRHTRNDGVEVVCPIRTVWFKRFVDLRAPGKDWAALKREEWNNVHCHDRVWRPAIDDGWILLLTIATASGERADIIASCD